MDVCAGEGAVVGGSPLALIERLTDTKIEREVAYDVVFQAYICPSSETIDGCTGVGVEYVVLVAIDTVCPITCVEELEAESHCERVGRQGGATDRGRVGNVLIDSETIGEGLVVAYCLSAVGQIGFGGGAEGEGVGGPTELKTSGIGGGSAFLACPCTKREKPRGVGE